jgi:hypothetical protein
MKRVYGMVRRYFTEDYIQLYPSCTYMLLKKGCKHEILRRCVSEDDMQLDRSYTRDTNKRYNRLLSSLGGGSQQASLLQHVMRKKGIKN